MTGGVLAHAVVSMAATLIAVGAVVAVLRDDLRARALVTAAAVVAVAAAASGFPIEPHYRNDLRQRLFVASPQLGWLFERKQHLGFAGACLLVAAACALAASSADEPDLRRAARVATAAGAAFLVFAAVASIVARA